jgi:hypothetical protein
VFQRTKRAVRAYGSYWASVIGAAFARPMAAEESIREWGRDALRIGRQVRQGGIRRAFVALRDSLSWAPPSTPGWTAADWQRALARQAGLAVLWASMALVATGTCVWTFHRAWPEEGVVGSGIFAMALALRAFAHVRIRRWLQRNRGGLCDGDDMVE